MPKSTKKKRTKTRPPKLSEFRFDAQEIDPGSWVDLNAAADEGGRLPRFKMVAYTGGIMRPRLGIPIYGRGIVLDLQGGRWQFIAGQIPANYQHDQKDPVGHCEETDIGDTVTAAGVLSVPGRSRDTIVEAADNGYRWRPSVEAMVDVTRVERIREGDTVHVNGRTFRGPLMVGRAGRFRGIAFVTTAGDDNATAEITATSDNSNDLLGTESESMTFEEFLEACGVDQEQASESQIANLQAAYDAQYGDPEPEPKPKPKPKKKPSQTETELEAGGEDDLDAVEEENRRLTANRQRVQTITDLCAAAGDPTIEVEQDGETVEIDLCAHAIEANMDPKDVELHIYRHSAPRGPGIHSRSRDDTHNVQAMTAAVLLASGVPLDSEHFTDDAAVTLNVPRYLRQGVDTDQRQQLLEAAHRYGDVNMWDLARDCVALDTGNPAPRNRDALLEAAGSSGSLHQVYNHTVGASLLVGYREQMGILPSWTGTDEVDGVGQERERHREDQMETLGYHAPNGEADHLFQSAHYECLQTDAYSGQREIGEEDFINNNLGLIARTPRKMGEAARRTEELLGWATLLSNPTMKSTGRQLFNGTDGTDFGSKPLNPDNASELIASMLEQVDGDAALDLFVRYCLVPAKLRDTAVQIFESVNLAEDSGQGSRNTLDDHDVMTITAPRLGIGARHPKTKAFHAGSDTTYYFVAGGVEVAVRVYLRGRSRAPRLRVTQLTQGKWGWHYDIKHFIGFAFLTTKGIFRGRSEA